MYSIVLFTWYEGTDWLIDWSLFNDAISNAKINGWYDMVIMLSGVMRFVVFTVVGSHFYPTDRGDRFSQNVCNHKQVYTSWPRWLQSKC